MFLTVEFLLALLVSNVLDIQILSFTMGQINLNLYESLYYQLEVSISRPIMEVSILVIWIWHTPCFFSFLVEGTRHAYML